MSPTTSGWRRFETTDADRTRWAVQDAIARLAVEQYGASWVQREPLGEGFPPRREPSPMAAIKACAAIEKIAHQRAGYYALEARGDGATWQDIAEQLGVAPDAFNSAASVAFERVAWPSPVARWNCRTCGQKVKDHGPENGPHQEEGHAANCDRHATEIRAVEAEWDD